MSCESSPKPAPFTADALLAGPRGRRLCLELAQRAALMSGGEENAYSRAAFYAAHAMDPDSGTSRVLFGPGAHQPHPEPSAADVAELLHDVPLPELSEGLLLSVLTAAVDWARYWQDPDGEDVLAASAPMRQALGRFAQALAESALTQWWSDPMAAGGQWSVRFIDNPPRAEAEPVAAGVALARWRNELRAEEARAVRERPVDPTAAASGSWWSAPPSNLIKSTRVAGASGPVGLHLVEDGFGQEDAQASCITPPPRPRMYEIDSPEAWAQLCRAAPVEVTASKRHDWFRTTGRDGRWLMPDWELVSQKFDGVHLTVGGYLTTAGLPVPVEGDFATVLAGWDPDAAYWLCGAESRPESMQHWRQVSDDPRWSLMGSEPVSMTSPARSWWSLQHSGYRVLSDSVLVGRGDEVWERAAPELLSWRVKTRSGFSVDTPGPVTPGALVKITARFLGMKVLEPVQVLTVVRESARVAFSYKTLPGHPVDGEEAFILDRRGDEVYLEIRSVTRAAQTQPWRALFPFLLKVQKQVRKRYLRALDPQAKPTAG